MQITYEPKRTEQFPDIQCVYWELTDDAQAVYPWWSNVPLDADIQAHLDEHTEEYWHDILRRMYPLGPEVFEVQPVPDVEIQPVPDVEIQPVEEVRNVTQPELEVEPQPTEEVVEKPKKEKKPKPNSKTHIQVKEEIIPLEDITSNPGTEVWTIIWPDKTMEQTIADHEERIAALETP